MTFVDYHRAKFGKEPLLKLTDVEIDEFKELKGIIGQTKAMGNSGSIEVNSQGLINEENEEKEQLEKKKKKELTEEEKARLKKKRNVKEDTISILRGISIRMSFFHRVNDKPM